MIVPIMFSGLRRSETSQNSYGNLLTAEMQPLSIPLIRRQFVIMDSTKFVKLNVITFKQTIGMHPLTFGIPESAMILQKCATGGLSSGAHG
jgi:hypothetical protein